MQDLYHQPHVVDIALSHCPKRREETLSCLRIRVMNNHLQSRVLNLAPSRSLYGDACLGKKNLQMVEICRLFGNKKGLKPETLNLKP